MREWILGLVEKAKAGEALKREDAEKVLSLRKQNFPLLLFAASELRQHFKADSIQTCSIVNAKSGLCKEDCSFCAQSAHHKTDINTYRLISREEILLKAAKEEDHSRRFGIVTAGRNLNKAEIETVRKAVAGFEEKKLKQIPCASLGILDEDEFRSLKQAGLTRYHHNLETSRNYYSRICSTHSYAERVATITAAKHVGLEICVGGILGLGESYAERIDLLYEIKELDPDSVPINFLVPIAGTPLEQVRQISLWEAVKAVALARFMMPDKDIKLGAGRLEVFKDAQHLVFLAGANGIIVGDLLTIKGRTVEDDLALINDLGLRISA
jgi:biotin synthase